MGVLDKDLNNHLRNASRRHVMAALAGTTALAVVAPWSQGFAAVAGMAPAQMRMAPDDDADFDGPDAVEGDTLEWLSAANPAAAAIVNDVVARSKLTFVAAAAGMDTGADPVGRASRTFIAARPAARRAQFEGAARTLMAAPLATRQRHFGRYAAIAPAEAARLTRPALAQRLGGPAVRRGSLSMATLGTTFGPVVMTEQPDFSGIIIPKTDPDAAAKQKAADEKAADAAAGKKLKHLEFYIRRVECFEGTGDPGGHDEIALAGYVIGATGHIVNVSQFNVSENFIPKSEGGQTNHQQSEISARDYGDINGRHFAWLNVNQSAPWPHDYQAGISMGELDWGGFAGFLEDLWDAVKTAVLDAIGEALAEGLGAAIGTAIPIPGLGTLIGLTIGALINFIIQAVKDDVVGTIHTKLTLSKMTGSYYKTLYPTNGHPNWHGHISSKSGIMYNREFKDSGRYKVKMGWRLFDEAGFDKRQVEINATLIKANGG
ncbi:MAG: hypothetical protein JWP35_4224 [Caulobacter sp.]|nr:hypothetical protein [Caulobacter sp.]